MGIKIEWYHQCLHVKNQIRSKNKGVILPK